MTDDKRNEAIGPSKEDADEEKKIDAKNSETREPENDAEFPATDTLADDQEIGVEPPVSNRRRSALVASMALLLSAIAIGIVGYDFAREFLGGDGDVKSDAEIESLQGSLENSQNALASLERNVASLNDKLTTSNTERDETMKSISDRFDDRLRQLEAIPGRMSSIEASVATVQGISTGARAAWLLAEAEYYMEIANAQLQLANNAELARTALAYADERVLQLGDPRLTDIRQALSDELRSLEVLETPDTAGITLTLASLANIVPSLPLRQETVVGENMTDDAESELTGFDRAIAAMKSSIGAAVKIRRADEAMQPLIAPEAQYFLRANLALQLQIARLALLRGEESVFRQSLEEADAWLAEYYEQSNNGVRNARTTLAEMGGNSVSVAAPDISRSLRLLRQFKALNVATDTDGADPEQDQ